MRLKKTVSLVMALCACAGMLAGCSGSQSNSAAAAGSGAAEGEQTYKVGVLQLVQHNALDAATQEAPSNPGQVPVFQS